MTKISSNGMRSRGIGPDIPPPKSMNPKLETVDDWIDFYEGLKRAASQNPDSKAEQFLTTQANAKLDELRIIRAEHGGRARLKSIVEPPTEKWRVWKLRYFDDDWWTNENYIHVDRAEAEHMAKKFREQPTSIGIAMMLEHHIPGRGDGPEKCSDCRYLERDVQFEESDCIAVNAGIVTASELYKFCPFRKVTDYHTKKA